MKKSFIFILAICTIVILFSVIANGQEEISAEITPSIEQVSSSNVLMSDLVFIPSSHDFGTYSEENTVSYNFQLKNLGGGTASGSVFVFGDSALTCKNGCTYSLANGQSQYVGIQFAPCDVDSAQVVHFDADIYAGNAQAYVEGTGIDPDGTRDCN